MNPKGAGEKLGWEEVGDPARNSRLSEAFASSFHQSLGVADDVQEGFLGSEIRKSGDRV